MSTNKVERPTKIGPHILTPLGLKEYRRAGFNLIAHEEFQVPPGQCSRALLAQCKYQQSAAKLAEKGFLPCFHAASQTIVVYKLEPRTKRSLALRR